MTEQPNKLTAKERDDTDMTNRRRVTDNPQPLDYVTQQLVSDIVENQQPKTPTPKSFIRKLLRMD